MTLPKTNCEAERHFSKLSIKNSTNHTRGKTGLSFFLSIENVTTKSLSFEEAIKEYAAKKCGWEKYYRGVSEVNKNKMLFFWIL